MCVGYLTIYVCDPLFDVSGQDDVLNSCSMGLHGCVDAFLHLHGC